MRYGTPAPIRDGSARAETAGATAERVAPAVIEWETEPVHGEEPEWPIWGYRFAAENDAMRS